MKAATPSQDWWFCSDRKTPIYRGTNKATNLAQIVARLKTAGNIVAAPRVNTATSMVTKTNARLRTALQIGAQSTIVISTLVNSRTVQSKPLLQAGIQKNVITISPVPRQAVLSKSDWMATILHLSFASIIIDAA